MAADFVATYHAFSAVESRQCWFYFTQQPKAESVYEINSTQNGTQTENKN